MLSRLSAFLWCLLDFIGYVQVFELGEKRRSGFFKNHYNTSSFILLTHWKTYQFLCLSRVSLVHPYPKQSFYSCFGVFFFACVGNIVKESAQRRQHQQLRLTEIVKCFARATRQIRRRGGCVATCCGNMLPTCHNFAMRNGNEPISFQLAGNMLFFCFCVV